MCYDVKADVSKKQRKLFATLFAATFSHMVVSCLVQCGTALVNLKLLQLN